MQSFSYYCIKKRKAEISKSCKQIMELDLIFKIAAIGVIVAILNQLLTKSDKSEYATMTTIAGIILVLLMIIPQIKELFESIREIVDF